MKSTANSQRPSVLIVDDDPAVREALAEELAEHYVVTTADSGETALQILSDKAFDAIVSDVRMPGIDGVELVRRAHRVNADMVRVLLTGYSDETAVQAAWSPGGVYKLNKPFGDELEIILRRALEHRNRMDNARRTLDRERQARERAQMTVVRLDKMALLGTLTSSVAHEMRSPLSYLSANFHWFESSVSQLAELVELLGTVLTHQGLPQDLVVDAARDKWHLLKAPELLHEMKTVCLECHDGIRRMTEIVDGLRAYASPSKRRCQSVDLCQCVDRAVRMVAAKYKRDVTVRATFAPDVPRIIGHEGELSQIVINLLINGIQAMGEEGEIFVRVQRRDEQVEVEVEDSGPGVPADVAPRIFDPFYTTKGDDEGTGLGLAISRGIARRHNGDLFLRDAAHAGAVFVLELPILPTTDES